MPETATQAGKLILSISINADDLQAAIDQATEEVVTNLTQPKIGEFWEEQGGIVAGLIRGENNSPDYWLIVPTDPAAYIKSIKWGGYGTEEPGADSYLDGLANTTALNNSEIKHPAAQWAASLSINGHSDLYLPSRGEIRVAWVNVPELFEDGYYWTSTQCSADDAFFQDFSGGGQSTLDKSYELAARAVRRVLVIQ